MLYKTLQTEKVISAKKIFYNLCQKELNLRKDTKNYKKIQKNVEDILTTWINIEQTPFIMPRFVNRCCSSTTNTTEITELQSKVTSLIKFIEEKTEKEEQSHKLLEETNKEIIDSKNKLKSYNDNLKKITKDANEELNKTVLKQKTQITTLVKTIEDLSKNVLTLQNKVGELKMEMSEQNKPCILSKAISLQTYHSNKNADSQSVSNSKKSSKSSVTVKQPVSNSDHSCTKQSTESVNQSNTKSHHISKNKSLITFNQSPRKTNPTTTIPNQSPSADNRKPNKVINSPRKEQLMKNVNQSQTNTNQLEYNQSPNHYPPIQQSTLNVDTLPTNTNHSQEPIVYDNPSTIYEQTVRNINQSPQRTVINTNQITTPVTTNNESYANQVRKTTTPSPTRRTQNIPALLDLQVSSPNRNTSNFTSNFNSTSIFQTPINNNSERDISNRLKILRQQSSANYSSNHSNREEVMTGNSFTTKSGVAILYVGRCHLTSTLDDLKILVQLETKIQLFSLLN